MKGGRIGGRKTDGIFVRGLQPKGQCLNIKHVHVFSCACMFVRSEAVPGEASNASNYTEMTEKILDFSLHRACAETPD